MHCVSPNSRSKHRALEEQELCLGSIAYRCVWGDEPSGVQLQPRPRHVGWELPTPGGGRPMPRPVSYTPPLTGATLQEAGRSQSCTDVLPMNCQSSCQHWALVTTVSQGVPQRTSPGYPPVGEPVSLSQRRESDCGPLEPRRITDLHEAGPADRRGREQPLVFEVRYVYVSNSRMCLFT